MILLGLYALFMALISETKHLLIYWSLVAIYWFIAYVHKCLEGAFEGMDEEKWK